MQTEIITEAGTVIGIYDPKDEHDHLLVESVVDIEKASQSAWGEAAAKTVEEAQKKLNAVRDAQKTTAGKKLKRAAASSLPKTTAGKVALVAIPAAAVAANSQPAKTKYRETRDLRHYRPASPYYDDGFGKASTGAAKKTLRQTFDTWKRSRTESIPQAAYNKVKAAANSMKTTVGPTLKHEAGAAAKGAVKNDGFMLGATNLAATGAAAAGTAGMAAIAARRAAKVRALKQAKMRQYGRDAALVGSVAAPTYLIGRKMSERRFEKAMGFKTLKQTGKKLWGAAKDPKTGKKISEGMKVVSDDVAAMATNARSVNADVRAMLGRPVKKPGSMTTGQKIALGGAGVGGLLIGRQLSGPKPYPYQQQR